jgi:hypothetical protein
MKKKSVRKVSTSEHRKDAQKLSKIFIKIFALLKSELIAQKLSEIFIKFFTPLRAKKNEENLLNFLLNF